MPVQIFFCYAHEDELLLKKLKTHLKPLQRQGLIDLWHDRDIIAGTDWQREISKHLNEAQIILLLVSSDFMESDYCYGIEMKRALERQECGEKCVIPIIIRHVYWQAALGKLQALPTDGIPVTDPYWHDWDRAFFDVAKGIRRAAENWIDKIRWLDEGNAQYKAREYAKALAAYGEALRIDASFAKAYNGKGDVLRDLRRNEEALVAYERATAFKPDYMWAWHNIGIVLHRIRRYEEAIAPFERAIELDPANVWPWFEKGQALRYLRRFEEALISYERASELDPNNRHAWQNKGKVLFELERYEESLEAYKKAILLGLSPSDHYCYIVRTL